MFKTVSELPEDIKKKLMGNAKHIYMNASNTAEVKGMSAEDCAKAGMDACENAGYDMRNGQMMEKVNKESKEITIVESPLIFDKPTGNKFWKEILYEGTFANPNDSKKKIVFTSDRFQKIIDNFKMDYVDAVYVPLNHSSNPKDNTGFVQDLKMDNSKKHPGKKGLFAKVEIVLNDIAEKIGKTIRGCSVRLEPFTSPKTGEKVGEILSHLALTNDQYMPELEGFQEAEFSRENANKVNFYRFETEDNLEEDIKMEKELLEIKAKMLELERTNKEQADKIEASRKGNETLANEKLEMEKKLFAGEVKNKVDALVLSRKIKSGEVAKHSDFAIKLGRENGFEYLKNLESGEDVIDTTILSKTGGETKKVKGETSLKASRINKIFADFIMGKGGNKLNPTTLESTNLERAVSEWNAMVLEYKGAEKINLEMDIDETIKFTRHPYSAE